MNRNKMLLGLSVLFIISVAVVSYFQLGKRDSNNTLQQGTYTNIKYGFQIASSNPSNSTGPLEVDDPFVNQKSVQYAIDDNTAVTIISNVGATAYADAIGANAGPYLVERKKVLVNNKEAEYLQMGFANKTKTHDYIFNKGADSIIVTIHLPETQSPQSIINSFVF